MTAQHVWVLTDESNDGDFGDTLSCFGVFTTREKALEYWREWIVAPETADRIVWSYPQSPFLLEGHDPEGKYAFICTRFELDGEE